MDYLLTTTLIGLKEVNTLVIDITREKMDPLYLELLNKYEVFSLVLSPISPDEKRWIREGVKYQTLQLSTLIETLKPYDRKEDNTRTFPKASAERNPNEVSQD